MDLFVSVGVGVLWERRRRRAHIFFGGGDWLVDGMECGWLGWCALFFSYDLFCFKMKMVKLLDGWVDG